MGQTDNCITYELDGETRCVSLNSILLTEMNTEDEKRLAFIFDHPTHIPNTR